MPFMSDAYMLALLRWDPGEAQSCLEETEELVICFLEERQNSCLEPAGPAWARALSVRLPQEDQRRWSQAFPLLFYQGLLSRLPHGQSGFFFQMSAGW